MKKGGEEKRRRWSFLTESPQVFLFRLTEKKNGEAQTEKQNGKTDRIEHLEKKKRFFFLLYLGLPTDLRCL